MGSGIGGSMAFADRMGRLGGFRQARRGVAERRMIRECILLLNGEHIGFASTKFEILRMWWTLWNDSVVTMQQSFSNIKSLQALRTSILAIDVFDNPANQPVLYSLKCLPD